MNQTSDRAKSIFLDAIELPDDDQRNAFVVTECGDDEPLRNAVDRLLQNYGDLGSFMHYAPAQGPTLDGPVAEGPGDTIGPYKLLEQIGEGGFGVVFLAEQTEPVRREVALKIVKAGMDTKEVVARFEAERQALAMMDHPNIAKVLGGGATDSGRPYFVMELVPGVPITDYCDQCKLTTRERLGLFVSVCRAVQHAHQKGVIHRDLKPSNVLIAIQDGVPTAKIIDFGVAKAINQRLTEHTLKTRFAQIIGTPLYMSPEQAELSPLGVDTRSDIYSLGVLLYELLTGTTPFGKERLQSASFDELRQIIREEEPPKPSTRLSTLEGDLAQTIADCRRTDVRRMVHTVRGDLDWIVMKAMEKDRTRRYDAANSLARDVERFLTNEPVEACPPSASYRFLKFVRRNHAVIATIAIVVIALLVGTGIATWEAIRAKAERDRAVAAERRASAEAARSEQVAQFLKDMLAAAGPSVARGRDATVLREVLTKATERVEHDLQGQPEVQGDVCLTIATAYRDIGDFPACIPMLEKAVACYRQQPGGSNTKLAFVFGRLGERHSFLGDIETGQRTAQLGLDMAEELGDPETLANCLHFRGRSLVDWGQGAPESEPYYRKELAIWKELGDRPLSEANAMSNLSWCGIPVEEAESFARQSLKIYEERLGTDHPNYANALLSLGDRLLDRGKVDEAEAVLQQTWETWQQVFDHDHPYNIEIVPRSFALAIELQGDRERARAFYFDQLPDDDRRPHLYRVYWGRLFRYLLILNRIHDVADLAEEIEEKIAELGKDDEEVSPYKELRANMRKKLDNSGLWLTSAAALLSSQDFTSFDALCKRMATRFQNTYDPITAERTCRVCLLRAGVVDPDQLPRRVLIATVTDETTSQNTLPRNYAACGLLAYREGDAERALTYANESQARIDAVKAPLRPEYIAILNHSVIALAADELGQANAAEAALRDATRLFDHMRDEGLSDQLDLVIANVVYQEAMAKIDGDREVPTEVTP